MQMAATILKNSSVVLGLALGIGRLRGETFCKSIMLEGTHDFAHAHSQCKRGSCAFLIVLARIEGPLRLLTSLEGRSKRLDQLSRLLGTDLDVSISIFVVSCDRDHLGLISLFPCGLIPPGILLDAIPNLDTLSELVLHCRGRQHR